MSKTYCSKSNKCTYADCPRHLKGFNGLYISIAEFNCKEEYAQLKTKEIEKQEEK